MLLLILAIAQLGGCRSSSQSARVERADHDERYEEGEDHDERREEEEEEFEHAPPPPPMPWGGGITLEPGDGPSDTLTFHIGSPLFIRMRGAAPACEPFNGTPFYFDLNGAQLGWGFEEVADSFLFPHAAGSCERIIMLSSENSNRVAEGYYTFKTLIFLDAASRLYSDTLVLRAVRSHTGADTVSYARFLQEQVIKNSPMLSDPETLRALFAQGTPRSAESEIFRGVILYRIGDTSGADGALSSSRELERRRGRPVAGTAVEARTWLARRLAY